MSELLDFLEYPSREEINKVFESVLLKDLYLEIDFDKISSDKNKTSLNNMDLKIFNDRIKTLNIKLGKLKFTYTFLIHFYNKDPINYKELEERNKKYIEEIQKMNDKEKIIEISEKIEEINKIEELTEDKVFNDYWYNYYVEIFYYSVFTIFDLIFHLFNTYYQMDVEPGMEFRSKVIKILKTKNKDLYSYCNKIHKNSAYKRGNDLRDNITHNLPPGEMKYPIDRKIIDGEKLVIDERTIEKLTVIITDESKLNYLRLQCKDKDFNSCSYLLKKEAKFTEAEIDIIKQNVTKKKTKYRQYNLGNFSYVRPWEFKENIVQLLELLGGMLKYLKHYLEKEA